MDFQLHYQHYLHRGKILLSLWYIMSSRQKILRSIPLGNHTYKGKYHSCQVVIHKWDTCQMGIDHPFFIQREIIQLWNIRASSPGNKLICLRSLIKLPNQILTHTWTQLLIPHNACSLLIKVSVESITHAGTCA